MGKKIQRIGRYSLDGVTLGWGNFAKVDLATHEITRVKVAIKIIDTKKIKDEYVRANLHREAKIMACLKHPHIVRLYETLKATTLYCLVTEFITGGDLLDHIRSHENQCLDESSSRMFIRQLLSALAYLHERSIVHRDLKMENVLLDEKKKNLKIIDFGLSNVCKKSLMRTHCGSPEYAAPELFIVGKTYGPEIDIWSLGVITYAMNLGKLPFSSLSSDDYHKHKMLQQIQKGLSASHEKEMQILSASCRNLLHQLIEPQPQLRIPLSEIEKHPWITKNGKHPFFRFTAFPKSIILRNQVIGELSYLSEIKKGILNEIVRENKTDEISAMFNMMLDKKKRELGYFDMDHTKRCQSKSTEKTSTPESCKTTSTLSRKVKTKKNAPKSEFLPRRANELRKQMSSKCEVGDPTSDNLQDEKLSHATPNDACNLIFFPQPYFQHFQPRTTCTPPLKLSMTLDLSVANLCSNADQVYQPQPTTERHNYDSLYGVAASSGVPPRMSPKEETKPLPRKPKRSTFCSISLRKKLVFPCGHGSRETIPDKGSNLERNNVASFCYGRNLCRPTTLFLKMKTKKSSFFSKSKELSCKNPSFDKVIAPRASPESSLVEASSSSFSMNEDDKCASNWNIEGSTPTKESQVCKETAIRDGGVQITKKLNVFFSQRISMSLDCLLPTLKKSIHAANYNNNISSNSNNNNNNINSSTNSNNNNNNNNNKTSDVATPTNRVKEEDEHVFSNHVQQSSDVISRKSNAGKFIHLHSKNQDASLGSSSSPNFPVDEMLLLKAGKRCVSENDDVT